MDEERVFSLSYEQLTRIAEKNIRECGLDNQSARCISELKASALLWLWYELAIHGAPQNNHAQARERIDTDYQRLKNSSGRRVTVNDSEPPTVATAAESADCAGCA